MRHIDKNEFFKYVLICGKEQKAPQLYGKTKIYLILRKLLRFLLPLSAFFFSFLKIGDWPCGSNHVPINENLF